MKVQLKGIQNEKELTTIFNSVSRIVCMLNQGNSDALYNKRVNYILDNLSEELQKNPAQYVIYSNGTYTIIVYVYDTDGVKDSSEYEIIAKEDNVLFEEDNALDVIFIPRQLIVTGNAKYVYTAAFVMLHLTFSLLAKRNGIASTTVNDVNLSSVSSLLAASIIADNILFNNEKYNNVFGEYKDITKKTIDKLYDEGVITIGGNYPHIPTVKYGLVSESVTIFAQIIMQYLHSVHQINGVKEYE